MVSVATENATEMPSMGEIAGSPACGPPASVTIAARVVDVVDSGGSVLVVVGTVDVTTGSVVVEWVGG